MIADSLLSLRNEVQRFKYLVFYKLIHDDNNAISTNL